MIGRAELVASRRTIAPLAAAATFALLLWFAFQHKSPGLNLWPDLITGLSTATVYGGALAAGGAALVAGAGTSDNSVRFATSARNPIWANFGHLLILVGYQIAGFGLALVVLWVYSAATNTYGSPDPAWLMAIGATLILNTALGYVAGTVLPDRWYTAPLIAVFAYAAFVFIRILRVPFTAESMFPAITNLDTVFSRSVVATMLGQCALWIGAAIALPLTVSAIRYLDRARIPLIVAATAAAVAIVGAFTVAGTNGRYTVGHNPRDYLCIDGSPTMCVNKGYTAAANDLYTAFTRLNTIAQGTPLQATRLEQSLEGVDDSTATGTRNFYVEQYGGPQDIGFSVQRYVEQYAGARCSTPEYSHVQAKLFIDAWLSGYEPEYFRADNADQIRHLDNLNALTAAEGHTWFLANFNAYLECSLTVDQLP